MDIAGLSGEATCPSSLNNCSDEKPHARPARPSSPCIQGRQDQPIGESGNLPKLHALCFEQGKSWAVTPELRSMNFGWDVTQGRVANQRQDSIKGSEPAWMPFVVIDVFYCDGSQLAC